MLYILRSLILVLTIIVHASLTEPVNLVGTQLVNNIDSLTEANIMTSAFQYLGVDSASRSCKNAKIEFGMAKRENITFPYVYDRLMDDSVYLVTVPNVPVASRRTPIERDFHLYFDPTDGTLLRIYSLCENVGSSDTLPKPNPVVSKAYFSTTRFPYLRIPNYTPEVNFLQALESCNLDPASAKELEGYFIDHSEENGPEHDVWLIVIRGSELLVPMMGRGAKSNNIPDYLRNGAISRVNAHSGGLLSEENLPIDYGE